MSEKPLTIKEWRNEVFQQRITSIEERIQALEKRAIDSRFDRIEGCLEALEEDVGDRLDTINQRIDALAKEKEGVAKRCRQLEERFQELESKVQSSNDHLEEIYQIAKRVSNMQAMFQVNVHNKINIIIQYLQIGSNENSPSVASPPIDRVEPESSEPMTSTPRVVMHPLPHGSDIRQTEDDSKDNSVHSVSSVCGSSKEQSVPTSPPSINEPALDAPAPPTATTSPPDNAPLPSPKNNHEVLNATSPVERPWIPPASPSSTASFEPKTITINNVRLYSAPRGIITPKLEGTGQVTVERLSSRYEVSFKSGNSKGRWWMKTDTKVHSLKEPQKGLVWKAYPIVSMNPSVTETLAIMFGNAGDAQKFSQFFEANFAKNN